MSTLLYRRRKLGMGSCKGLMEQMQTPVQIIRNDIAEKNGFPQGIDLVIRWGCTGNIPIKNVLNTAKAIHQVNDKLGFRKTLTQMADHLAPATRYDRDDPTITYPCIVRPNHHHQGKQLHVCKNWAELRDACAKYPQYYISELINKAEEFRVFMVQGRVASVAKKTPGNPKDVAWNVAQGGRFDNVKWNEWPLQAVRKSVEAFNLSGLDFGGVDVMTDGNGQAYIIEINSAPSLPMLEDGSPTYRQLCMAKCFDWIVNSGKERIALIQEKGGYLKFIHPAVEPKAKLV